MDETPQITSSNFDDMIEEGQPSQPYLDDEFTCVSESEPSLSTKASRRVYKKKIKRRVTVRVTKL